MTSVAAGRASAEEITHDSEYLKYLQKVFGTTTVPLFGGIICVFTLIVILFAIAINSAFSIEPSTKQTFVQQIPKTILNRPILVTK